MKAISEVKFDLWTTKGKKIRTGDRVLIWKCRGQERQRGVVAFGEVTTNPEVLTDANNPYWNLPLNRLVQERVQVRYIHAQRLPMWRDDQTCQVLDQLSVSRARGGSVFIVTTAQWDMVLTAAGGWPSASPPVEEGV